MLYSTYLQIFQCLSAVGTVLRFSGCQNENLSEAPPMQLTIQQHPYYPNPKNKPQKRYHGLLISLLVSFLAGVFSGYMELFEIIWTYSLKKLSFGKSNPEPGGSTSTIERKKSTVQLIGALARAQLNMEAELIADYGEFYGLLFDRIAMESVLRINPPSKERLLRRVMLKILEASRIQNTEQQQHGNKQKVKQKKTTFTFSTAGDSRAAAHGNIFTQSYTSVIDATVKEGFAALGIKFQAKNYAMGGYVSGPELAMCMESIFGSDIDILTWDFGLMESDDRASLWCSRAAVHPTKPILLAFDYSDNSQWGQQFLSYEQQGMGIILFDQTQKGLGRIRNRIPDAVRSVGGKDAIPSTLRNYMCSGSIEGAIPCNDTLRHNLCNLDQETAEECIRDKFKTKHICADANKYQQSWHPGWKDHYLKGRLIGFFLMELLMRATVALDELVTASGEEAAWDILQFQEDTDVKLAQDAIPLLGKVWEPYQSTVSAIGPHVLFKSPTVCHTALFPAQERYDGILTGKRGSSDLSEYDRGTSRYHVQFPAKDGQLALTFDPNDRQKCDALEIDHKDFFWVREGDGMLSMIVPNDSELSAYRRSQQVEGLIMVCLKICPLKRCPDDVIGFGPLKRGTENLQIRVDDRPVVGVQKFSDCHFLQGEHGVRWGPGRNGNGQYKVSFLVNDKRRSNMKISSIIVF